MAVATGRKRKTTSRPLQPAACMTVERQGTNLRAIRMPHAGQLAFIKSGALFKRAVTGQGGGKTVAGVFEVRRYAKRHPGSIYICTEPTYPMVRDILKKEFDRQFAAAEETAEWNVEEHKYYMPNNSEIWLRAAMDPNRLRGPSVAAAWMDEAEDQPYSAFQVLTGRLRQPGYPHCMMFTGTPRGQSWLYWIFTKGDRPDGAPPYLGDIIKQELGEQAWLEPETYHWSSLDNTHLDPVTKAMLKASYVPGTLGYRQEVLGEAVKAEGVIYPYVFTDHVRDPDPSVRLVKVVGAADWGWTNPGCLLIIGLDSNDNVWVLDEVYEVERDVRDWWAAQAVRLNREWHVNGGWFCDPAEPDNIETFRKAGLDAQAANNSVIPGITVVANRFAKGNIYVTSRCRNLQRELGLYSWKKAPDGQYRKDEPEKVNDHSPDTLRYGMMGLLEGGSSFFQLL